jgi:hypothetical protein
MKKRLWVWLVLGMCLFSAGCVPLIIGAAAGGLGAYAVSKDTIEGDTDTPYENLWDAAVELSKVRGTVKVQDFTKGTIEFEARPSKVWIRFTRLTQATTRVRISSRKNHLPNLELAQDVFVRLIERARGLSDDSYRE